MIRSEGGLRCLATSARLFCTSGCVLTATRVRSAWSQARNEQQIKSDLSSRGVISLSYHAAGLWCLNQSCDVFGVAAFILIGGLSSPLIPSSSDPASRYNLTWRRLRHSYPCFPRPVSGDLLDSDSFSPIRYFFFPLFSISVSIFLVLSISPFLQPVSLN